MEKATPFISGFSFVRNAFRYGYPVLESLRSLLPICDEVVVAVGDSDDGTLEAIRGLGDPKLHIIETTWYPTEPGWRILAEQTQIALNACRGTWCIYLQADEVLHEQDYPLIWQSLEQAVADERVEAFVLRYYHFYGSYDYIGTGRQWYRREIRIVRNSGNVISWGDAQGFRKRLPDGRTQLLRARELPVYVYHYGWVRPPKVMLQKLRSFHQLWHDEEWIQQHLPHGEAFDYRSAYRVQRFTGTHPAVMHERIERDREWTQFFDPRRLAKAPLRVRLSDWLEALTGWRIGEYRNFRLLR
ncbi:MAG: glycosyltransferase family 2 protein [Candidatus Kapabacteria bacterium]|nr:glycosyltransferase family 2 protein [Candidatus Kapabacteria bacterium]MDW8012190.1 glycosyltransferase family 2 protein [Bacteroidota bacterium]